MAKRDWSRTAADNDDADGDIAIGPTSSVRGGDDAIRGVMQKDAIYLADTNGSRSTAGSSNTYTYASAGASATPSDGFSAYATGDVLILQANHANTGAATLNVDSVGAKAIRKYESGSEAALASGDIAANSLIHLIYDADANSSAGAWILMNPAAATTVGQHTIWMPAGAMTPTSTNGAAAATEELATNDVMLGYLAFDDSTRENACFQIQMPKSWNEGTLVCQFVWKCGATSGDVIWGIQAVAFADDDALDTAFGTAVEVTDTAGGAADDCMISDETSAMTVAGSPSAEELVVFKVYRDAADGSDTLSGDAELLGVKIHYTTNAGTDS